MKLVSIINILSILISAFLMYIPLGSVNAATVNVNVKATASKTAGFYWCERSDGSWQATHDGGTFYVPDAGNKPSSKHVTFSVNFTLPNVGWEDGNGNTYNLSDLTTNSTSIDSVIKENVPMGTSVTHSGNTITFSGTIGGSIEGNPIAAPNEHCGSNNAYVHLYPVLVTWLGTKVITTPDEIFEGLSITPTPSTIQVDQQESYVVREHWKRNGDSTSDVIPNALLTWSSSDTSKATVNHGIATGRSPTTSDIDITATYAAQNASVTAKLKVIAKPTHIITGEVDILDKNLTWRDTIAIRPKNVVIPSSCTYAYHQYQIVRDGITYTSARIYGLSNTTSYSHGNYPSVISVGTHTVYINITANCAESGWTGPDSFNMAGMTDNKPPDFSLGWTTPGNRTTSGIQTSVVVGSKLDIAILDSPAPTDPDGDTIHYGVFEFTTPGWAQTIPTNNPFYGNGYLDVVMSEVGFFCARASMIDEFGASTVRTACVDVVPANPVPIIKVPNVVRENHPVTPAIHSSDSYSPVPGRSIDHARDSWTNRKEVYPEPGPQTVTLEVFDNTGLRSIRPASETFIVLPDEPPVAVVEVDPLGIRQETYDILNKSYSTDGDTIVTANYRYRYDAANDGFHNDEWVPLPGNLTKSQITPAAVGKYEIELQVIEEYGQSATATAVIDVTNLAPTVSFVMEGNNPIPEEPVHVGIDVKQVLATWTNYAFNSTSAQPNKPYMWTTDGSKLMMGLGKGMEQQTSYVVDTGLDSNKSYYRYFMQHSDNGFGPNSLSPYKSIATRDLTKSGLVLVPKYGTYSFTTGEDYQTLEPARFASFIRSTDTHVVFDQSIYYSGTPTTYVLGLNKSRLPQVNQIVSWDGSKNLLIHAWEGPNPYDYIVRMPPYLDFELPIYYSWQQPNGWRAKADAGDYSGTTNIRKTYNDMGSALAKVEVSGSRIYAVYKGIPKYMYESDSDTYTVKDYNGIVVVIYDAATGEKIGQTTENITGLNTNNLQLLVLGDNLVVRSATNNTVRYVEMDRSGKLVASGTTAVPSTVQLGYKLATQNWDGGAITYGPATNYTCAFQTPTGLWKDDLGNTYAYYVANCNGFTDYNVNINPNFAAGLYLVQFTRDHTFSQAIKLKGTSARSIFNAYTFPYVADKEPVIAIDTITRKAYVRSFSQHYAPGNVVPTDAQHVQVVDLATGVASATSQVLTITPAMGSGFAIRHTGALADGWFTSTASGGLDKFNYYHDKNVMFENISIAGYTNRTVSYGFRFGEYVGDGMYLSMYNTYWQTIAIGYNGSGYNDGTYMYLDVGTPSSANTYPGFQYGHLLSPDTHSDAEISAVLSMDKPSQSTTLAGISFRMQDGRNFYAVEADGARIYVSKYVNGTRTVLDSRNIALQAKTGYKLKIKTTGSRIEVYLGNVPYFDVTDTQFASGKYGVFANRSYVHFSVIYAKAIEADDNWQRSYAILEEGAAEATLRVTEQVFSDPEDDPIAGELEWQIEHTPKFLNHQGLSAWHGRTLATPTLSLDKIGIYRMALRAQDDPNSSYLYPEMAFSDYRKYSNAFWQYITVHRRPVAAFTLSIDPGTGYVAWADESYDPDRWASSTVYSTEATGINYGTTRGILEHRYYYVAPDGTLTEQKLVTPTLPGTYTVGLQVRDEYGAWSSWSEQTITVDTPVEPNKPPVAGFTVSPAVGYRNTMFTINSTASDPEDGARTNLTHAYYIRNKTTGSAEVPVSACGACRTSWQMSFSELGEYEIRQMVTDSVGMTAQATRSLEVVNRSPVANFTMSPNPSWQGDTVTFTNTSSDADQDTLIDSWQIHDSSGRLVQNGASRHLMYRFLTPGAYTVTLTVSDGYTQAMKQAVMTVRPLVLEPDVSHTSSWFDYHQRAGHEVLTPPKAFFSGEQFVLSATGSEAEIAKVEAWLDTVGRDEQRIYVSTELILSPSSQRYEGILYDELFSSLKQGLPIGRHDILFRMTYANGFVLTRYVPISIIGHVQQTVNVHRLH